MANELAITANPETTTDGVTRLQWSVPEGTRVLIQQDSSEAFIDPVTFYQGTDNAAVITGLNNGQYFFRGKLQYQDGSFSDSSKPVRVDVKHHSLNRAMLFFFIGAIVFTATVLLIFFGARNQEKMA